MTPQELKNSILQLAIQGKLVEQRPEEGTAAELLEKILAAKNAKSAKKNLTRSRGARGEKETSALFASPLRLTEDGFEPKVEGFSATNIALKDVLQLICESCDYCYVINSDGTLCFLPKYTESLIPTIRECESD